MHHIYTTKAIIIKSVPAGEANKIYFLLTKDLGFIRASAQSVRLDKSKLKGHLEELSFVSVSAVKGREIWRITNVETIYQNNFLNDLEKLGIVKNIFSLLLRLLHGEEKNEALFDRIDSFYTFVLKNDLSKTDIKNLEAIVVLQILHELGYLKETTTLSEFTKDTIVSLDLLAHMQEKRSYAISEINDALHHSNL